MSHFGDSMDGVPVKISEKYKRPPRIVLPYSVVETPIRAQNVVDSVNYCSTFEQNVLSKLKELRSAKETKKNERRHRLQLLEEAKQKKLDAIAAAEAEEKLKQLSVSEVSYPSTDEISALSPDDKPDKNCDESTQDNSPEADKVITTDPEYINNPIQEPLKILQPIQIQSSYPQSSLLDDPDPLQEFKIKFTKIPHSSRNVDTLTFKDFENDTSSPFDNVELKTINDMELLAQVLDSQRDSTVTVVPQVYNPEQNYASCATQSQIGTYLPNSYMEQPTQSSNTMYSSPQHYPISGGYYVPQETVCDNALPVDNIYVPNYQYYVPTQSYPLPNQYYNNQLPSNSGEMQIPQYYYQYPQTAMPYVPNAYNTVQEVTNQVVIPSANSLNQVKSRSRSVPDIVKELNQELETKKRANERSYNASPAPINVPRSYSNSDKREQRRNRKVESLPSSFERLSPNLQNMCQKIHGMGFPFDRVTMVCKVIGDNDKKVIECLLLMGELMDLGFSEERVWAALTKHEFNRDNALDELV